MSEPGRERRAEIDNTTVRALLLLNGGGAIFLLAFLAILGNVDTGMFLLLIKWTFAGLGCFHLGLLVAVVHNHLRRRCSLVYERGDVEGDSDVCWWSWACLYGSMAFFFLGGVIVVIGSVKTFGRLL